MKKAFTITELLVAMGLMAAVLAASGMIFRYSVDAQRTASATSEIMRNLRAITDQLNADFDGLCKDGYLVLRSERDANDNNIDSIYYFSTGDFQSWFKPDIRSNIARIYFGHDNSSYSDLPGNLARGLVLLTPGQPNLPADCNDISYAGCKQDISNNFEDPNDVLDHQPDINIDNIDNDPNLVRRLLCQNVGDIRIEWTYGVPFGFSKIEWYGLDVPAGKPFELPSPYRARWTPYNTGSWPYALKFTFTLYDSNGIIKGGRTFTHIVYIGD